MRREMGDDQLTCGMDGVGGEIEGLSVDAVPCGEDGIGAIGAHVIEGEFCEREEIGPMGRWEGEMNGRQNSDEVILRCSDRPLGRVSAVLIGRDELVLD